MHMRKVRTTINLNEDVVRKAKSLKINISAIAERGIIDYIKELENIGRESASYSNYNIDNDDRQSSIRNNKNNTVRRGGDLNSCGENPHELSRLAPYRAEPPRQKKQ
jgi:hypothetical protein